MALKKDLFQKYVKDQAEEREKRALKSSISKYKHHRVFDEEPLTEISPEDTKLHASHSKEQIEQSISYEVDLAAQKKRKAKPVSSQKKVLVEEQVEARPNYEFVKSNFQLDTDNDLRKKILNLEGNQQKLFFGLLKLSYMQQVDKIEQISSEKLQAICSTNYGNTKLAISRLVSKGLLVRYQGKTAKGGYYSLGFEKKIQTLALTIADTMNIFKYEEHMVVEHVVN